jgi:hypothetical protein
MNVFLLRQVVSLVTLLLSAMTAVQLSNSDAKFNEKPMMALNMVFALVTVSLSSYQIVISFLLLWQALMVNKLSVS